MAEIRSFRGIRYAVEKDELWRVLAPPYDVISSAYRDALYARDPRNVVRIVLNRGLAEAGYREAAATFRSLLDNAVLAEDPSEALYVVEQRFEDEGASLTRLGLLASCRAEDASLGRILPHEHTRTAAKQDRWRLLLATHANFSPIFLMHDDPGGALDAALHAAASGHALAEYTDDLGVAHRLFRVDEGPAAAAFVGLLGQGRSYIADGHHRYATALRYRDEHGPEGAWTLAYFTPLQSPALVVLPYHRVLSAGPSLEFARDALAGLFLLTDARDARAAAQAVRHSTMPYAFAIAEPGHGALVAEALPEAEDLLSAETPGPLRALDAFFLHHAVLPKLLHVQETAVGYVHSLDEAETAVEESRCRLAVLMRGTPVRQIVEVALAGLSMPPKSTFFHPKLPSGLVIHRIRE